MAFDRFVNFYTISDLDRDGNPNEGAIDGRYPVEFNGMQYVTFNTWAEYVLSPVLTDAQSIASFNPTGQVVIRVPYNPILTQAFARLRRPDRDGNRPLVEQSWDHFVVDDYQYDIDGMQISEGQRYIDITGTNGTSTFLPGR